MTNVSGPYGSGAQCQTGTANTMTVTGGTPNATVTCSVWFGEYLNENNELLPADETVTLTLDANGEGTFSLDVPAVPGGGTVDIYLTFESNPESWADFTRLLGVLNPN